MKEEAELYRGKDTWAHLEKIQRFGYSNATLFPDFLDTCLYSLLSLTDNIRYPDFLQKFRHNALTGTYEDAYLQLVRKYKENETREPGTRPIDFMQNAWGSLLQETLESQQDILGEIFMAKVSFGEHGQFFTPANVSDMMARLLYSGESKDGETVCDPCCGSGRFFISVSKVHTNARFYGVDLSPTCAKMTALNMWLFNLDADIYHGDSLALRMFHVWKIRKGGFVYESEITESIPPMPEKVRRTLKIQAEQQKLFDFDESEKREEVKR